MVYEVCAARHACQAPGPPGAVPAHAVPSGAVLPGASLPGAAHGSVHRRDRLPLQGVSYYEKDGYYAKDDVAHEEASAWAGRGAEAMGLSGAVEPEVFRKVLEGHVPGGRQLGRKARDGAINHRPNIDVTLSAPKSVSPAALVGGDRRIIKAHDKAVKGTLDWIENRAIETRLMDPRTGAMVRNGNQKMVAAHFTHDTSRNLDPQLHTHAVIANMLQGEDQRWRTMVSDGVYRGVMAIGAIYRAQLPRGLEGLGYGIEKTHSDGRFEMEGVSREVIEAFSTRRAEIVEAMQERGLSEPGGNARLADRAALMRGPASGMWTGGDCKGTGRVRQANSISRPSAWSPMRRGRPPEHTLPVLRGICFPLRTSPPRSQRVGPWTT